MVAREKDEGRDREFRVDMYTLLYLKWIGNKDLLYSTWNSAQCYVAAWIEGEFGGKWIKMWYIIYTMEYYSAIKKNKIMPFSTT